MKRLLTHGLGPLSPTRPFAIISVAAQESWQSNSFPITFLQNKVDDKEGVYSAKVISFVAIIALCSYHLASALESSGEKTDPNKMALNASGAFLSFLEVEDKNKLITLGLEKAQNLYSSEPPNKWRDELFELTQKFCLSSSQEEDDKCIQAIFDIFNEILKTFKVKEKLNSEEESMYDGEI